MPPATVCGAPRRGDPGPCLPLPAEVQGSLESCLRGKVAVQLPRITRTLVSTVEAALVAVQTLLARGMDRLSLHLRGSSSGAQLRKEVSTSGWGVVGNGQCVNFAEGFREPCLFLV